LNILFVIVRSLPPPPLKFNAPPFPGHVLDSSREFDTTSDPGDVIETDPPLPPT
jgi:hypothetical protein